MSYIEAERDLPMHLVFRTDNFATLYRDDYGWFTAMHHMDSPHNVGLDAALSAAEDSLLAQANESLHRRGAQAFEPDHVPYNGETPFGLSLALDEFKATCDRWTEPIFGEPLEELERCVEIMNTEGDYVCQC